MIENDKLFIGSVIRNYEWSYFCAGVYIYCYTKIFFKFAYSLVNILLIMLENWSKLTTSTVNSSLNWIFTSKLVNAVVSFQSFSQFTLANRNLLSSSAYSNCQKRLLKQKIIIKKNKFKQYPLELNSVKKQVQGKMCFSNFWNNCAFFLNNNNKNLAELKIPETKNVKK